MLEGHGLRRTALNRFEGFWGSVHSKFSLSSEEGSQDPIGKFQTVFLTREALSLAFLEPVLQLHDVYGKVTTFLRSALVDDARYREVGIKEWSARHALGQLLSDFDELDSALHGDSADDAGSDVEWVSGRPTGISYRRRGIAGRDRMRCGIKLEVLGLWNLVIEDGQVSVLVALPNRSLERICML